VPLAGLHRLPHPAHAGPVDPPVHSLFDQSLRSRLGAETTNGDGFGIGWYDAAPSPGVFRSIEPAWNVQNLHEVSCHVSSPLFFAHIRAVIGSTVRQTNCHRSAMAGGCSTSGPRLICPPWSCASVTIAPPGRCGPAGRDVPRAGDTGERRVDRR
jgi:hypothetical protein